MIKKIIPVLILIGWWSCAHGMQSQPVAVSPGDVKGGIAVIGQVCPTFSWAPADGATGYRVKVYYAPPSDTPPMEQMASSAAALLDREIQAPALSWSPGSGECLAMEDTYIWYVGGIGPDGHETWSQGNRFAVTASAASQNTAATVRKKLYAWLAGQALSAPGQNEILQLWKGHFTNPAPGEAQPTTGNLMTGLISVQEDDPTGNYHDGYLAAADATTAEGYTVVGSFAGERLTTGNQNTFLGCGAGTFSYNGSRNTYLGSNAGGYVCIGPCDPDNQGANDNLFVGDEAGRFCNGGSNLFIGSLAGHPDLYSEHDHGDTENTFIGRRSGALNKTGSQNTFVGMESGRDNNSGSENVFAGKWAGLHNNLGSKNTFVGKSAGYDNTAGNENTAIGYGAGNQLGEGNGNTCIGAEAGFNNPPYERYANVFVGYQAGKNDVLSGQLYIANSDTAKPLIGGNLTDKILKVNGELQAFDAASSSDGRLKKEIHPLEAALEKVLQLEGVSYHWKTDVYPDWGFADTRQIGLIAQEVEAVMPELVNSDADGFKSVSYEKLTAVLVEALRTLKNEKVVLSRQLSEKVTQHQSKIAIQRRQIDELARLIRNQPI